MKRMEICACPSEEKSRKNRVFYNKKDFPYPTCYLKIESRRSCVFLGEASKDIKPGFLAMNKVQRITSRARMTKTYPVALYKISRRGFQLKCVTMFLRYKNNRGYTPSVDAEEILEDIRAILDSHILTPGQELGFFYEDKLVIARVGDEFQYFGVQSLLEEEDVGKKKRKRDKKVEEEEEDGEITSKLETVKRGILVQETKILLKALDVESGRKLVLKNIPTVAREGLFRGGKAKFKEMGIGGLDDQLMGIFRRAFTSRIYPQEGLNRFGVEHVKGVMLYGPPGTGKTLIARQIGELLNCRKPKLVKGPELLNSYVGQSEKNMRELFKEAEEEYAQKKEGSELHLIIFDEIDSLCKRRGSVRSGTAVHDNLVNQLLSKMDGLKPLNNILVIGMTNRLDLIDDALLRSGRFEVQVEIGLPNEPGRKDIFEIHLKTMKNNNALHRDVDVDELARLTKNFTGAEIAGVVRNAASYAMNVHIDFNDLEKTERNLKNVCGTAQARMKDFVRAIRETKPKFGMKESDFSSILSQPIISYGTRFDDLIERMKSKMIKFKEDKSRKLISLLLEGTKSTGKTSLAVHLACRISGYPFVKMISPQDMIGLGDREKCWKIKSVFEEAYKSPLSLIIIDGIEKICGYNKIGPVFSNVVLQALTALVSRLPPHGGRKLMVVGTVTTSQSGTTILDEMNLMEEFDYVFNIPRLSKDVEGEYEKVMTKAAEFEEGGALEEVVELLPKEISVKQLLLITKMAREAELGGNISVEGFRESLEDCRYIK